jgi:methylenetetrahydrofolate reductase (NADPH)
MVDRDHHPSLDEIMSVLLEKVGPSFISVTQGAGGGSREQSPHLLKALDRYAIPRCAHLICGYVTRAEVFRHAANFYSMGVRNFLVLKGDKPPHAVAEGDFVFASECIRELHALYPDVSIGAGAYPEAAEFDRVEVLRQKFEAGATFAITQMCFDVAAYTRLAREFTQPIIPGACFIHDEAHAAQFARRFGVTIPGVPYLPKLIDQYRKAGAPGVHLFLLNDLDSLDALNSMK